jgi:protein O-GlcNAc transferase
MALASEHHRNGRLEQAESICRQILSHAPNHLGALHLLTIVRGQRGQTIEAIELARRVVELKPDYSEAHNNLGIVLRQAGQLDAALASFRRAVELRPGNAARQAGKIDEAIQCYQRLAELAPGDGQVFNRLGLLQGIACRFEHAIASLRRAVELDPQLAEARSNLGTALSKVGQCEEALPHLQKAVELNPRFARAYLSLGVVRGLMGDVEQAAACYQRALEIEPNLAEAHSNLAAALREMGDVEGSIAESRKALELRPDSPALHSNLIFAMHFSPNSHAQAILAETRRFADRFERPLRAKWVSHSNDPDPNRRLRVGYLSADFRLHPMANCLIPLLKNHDPAAVEVFCYANVERADDVAGLLRSHSNHWRNVWGRSDDEVAGQVREDRIDILVDLSLHTADNRLPVLARKPAPVQATFLAYPGGSGLSAIDYRITDACLDPPGAGENDFVEKPIRLRHCYWCYEPLVGPEIEVAPPPVLAAGHVTFGCLNKFSKMSADAQELWAAILTRAGGSRLLLNVDAGKHRQALRERFEKKGVDPGRLEFVSRQPMGAYMRTYHLIDIALDPFPFCGGITTCDALWMGVPVVTLAGPTPISRGGCSILTSLGLTELIARSPEEYLQIAADLSADAGRLAGMREDMRQRMRNSPLTDGKGYAADVEAALREIWKTWCAGRKQSGS